MTLYVHWIFYLVYAVIVLAAVITVLMDNRQPAKTMAWIMVLSFVPLVGIVLYIFFGQNTRKMRFISQRSLNQLSKRSMLEFVEQGGLKLPKKYNTLIKLFANQNLSLPFKDNEVEIFTNGTDYFLSLLRAIGKAKNHIHIDIYIIDDDPLGRLVADALIDKANEGVEVRFIYDDVGCWKVHSGFFERMREAGIDVHSFMPVKFPAFTSKVNYRNHRKLCVIDGQIAYIGGMNIAMRYIRGDGSQPWRDTHVKVRGGAVYAVQCAFLVDWYFVDRTLVTNRKYYPPMPEKINNDCIAQVVTGSPISPWPDLMQGYVHVLLEAKQYIYMETPYYLPTEPVLCAMRTAALSGIDVRLMLPRHSDSHLLAWASVSYVSDTLAAGVKIYYYTAGFNHSKLLVSDDMLCSCGSSNIDFRSFENNFEANIFFYNKEMAMRRKKVFLEDQEHCVLAEEVLSATPRGFLLRLWESLVRLLSPLL